MNKPPGVTSHDVVAAVRAVTGLKKVGHTGTLDPFATGVLVLALGGATRLIQYLDESLKVYDATIRFGSTTDTGDLTGRSVREAPVPTAGEERARAVLEAMVGEQLQRPPPYSAVKHKGKPLYYYARRGLDIDVPPRKITIYGMELLEYNQDTMRVLIRCSKGTYARVLAQEIAEALGSAGHLEALERPQSGPFLLENSLDIDSLSKMVAAEPVDDWRAVLMGRGRGEDRVQWRPKQEVREALAPLVVSPFDVMNHLDAVQVTEGEADKILNGAKLPERNTTASSEKPYTVVCAGTLLAVVDRNEKGVKAVRLPRYS